MNRFRTTIVILCGILATACGPTTRHKKLKVRPGYTSKKVIETFESRFKAHKGLRSADSVVVQETNHAYETLRQATEDAPDGSTLLLSEGLYESTAVIQNKSLTLRGKGPNRTRVIAKETALVVRHGSVNVSGVGFFSHTVGDDVSVVAVLQS